MIWGLVCVTFSDSASRGYPFRTATIHYRAPFLIDGLPVFVRNVAPEFRL